MSDVEATRYMASEREIEFVDLDTYGVDPTAAAILPVDLSRRLRVVAVKRKFGTPVVAMADPDDLMAVDSIRASLGREFISVVAAPEQIDHYIESAWSTGGPVAPVATSLGDLAAEIATPDDAFDQAWAGLEQAPTVVPPPLPSIDLPTSIPDFGPPPVDVTRTNGPSEAPAAEDQLADLARALEQGVDTALAPEPSEVLDTEADAADLVAEAVASYHDQNPEAAPPDGELLAAFPRWPRPSSRGGGCRSMP